MKIQENFEKMQKLENNLKTVREQNQEEDDEFLNKIK